ncbi:hypothetical protein Baya_4683 [Bagarius yarrelli]|uniref:Uncharacterized protein n=1 Tax=Bagarius yarrelli TaxID=175774 RepID=A0A556TT78_BAGYA|nr:hypothetical protein Baya_4683 [Bagarius yarrelli]
MQVRNKAIPLDSPVCSEGLSINIVGTVEEAQMQSFVNHAPTKKRRSHLRTFSNKEPEDRRSCQEVQAEETLTLEGVGTRTCSVSG